MAKDPRYMSFDHQYVETVTVTDSDALADGVEAHRFVKRNGAYADAGGYAAGASIYRLYGQGELTAKGYQVDDGTTLVYEGQLNPSTTPLKPGVFPYQGLLSIVTTGIAIIEVAPNAGAISLDSPVWSDSSGRATTTGAGASIVMGRALDSAAASTAGQYIRVKLGNESGAYLSD